MDNQQLRSNTKFFSLQEDKMSKKLKFTDIIQRINDKWKGKFTILEDINTFQYKNVHQHISVKCNDCGKIYKDNDKKE